MASKNGVENLSIVCPPILRSSNAASVSGREPGRFNQAREGGAREVQGSRREPVLALEFG